MKVVLDTNVIVSGIFWSGPASDILDLWVQDKITVYISPEILEEYERLLSEMDRKKPTGMADVWRRFILKSSVLIRPEGAFRLCRDPDDDKFLHCAISAGVRVLVSGDKDLLVLKKVSGVGILSPSTFLRSLP